MSDDTLREQMIVVIADDGWQAETFGDRADEIIAMVREALLAPEVVEAACLFEDDDVLSESQRRWVREGCYSSLTAALDAAGLGGDGHE